MYRIFYLAIFLLVGACSKGSTENKRTLLITSSEPITIFYNGNKPPKVIFVKQEAPPGPDYMAYGNYYWLWK